MAKRLQQPEFTSGMAARATALAVDGAGLNAIFSIIVVLVLIVIPISGVALI